MARDLAGFALPFVTRGTPSRLDGRGAAATNDMAPFLKEHTMPQTPPLAIERYIATVDRAIADEAVLEELVDIFAPNAVVQLDDTPVRGSRAIRELYRDFIAIHVEAKHFWNATVLPDGRQRAEWACAARMSDGSLVTVAGLEHATVGTDDRIVDLRNELTRPPA
ncbi:nuclear transport factor 2 family protein [Prauserella cavernicola]|uniref:Nuclear transport factor 2 family protein n=1 Tax=Prauserella cavernicola TaxID=2800127 RepID=A0A934QX12_9PSEU|nr:nuclear transport factor 2 family protein [Prauserella cavernicola]MBK1787925.1 nuclear transport factor 2 family protein [Prauserella cavernicola]